MLKPKVKRINMLKKTFFKTRGGAFENILLDLKNIMIFFYNRNPRLPNGCIIEYSESTIAVHYIMKVGASYACKK